MGFFDQFAVDGKKVDGSEENSSVTVASIIPGGTKAVAMIEEVKWDEYQGDRKVRYAGSLQAADLQSALFSKALRFSTKTKTRHSVQLTYFVAYSC